MEKINIEEIFESQNPRDGKLPEWAKALCLEFGRQLLDLAAENVRTKEVKIGGTYHGLSYISEYGKVVDKNSIIDTIKQVE